MNKSTSLSMIYDKEIKCRHGTESIHGLHKIGEVIEAIYPYLITKNGKNKNHKAGILGR